MTDAEFNAKLVLAFTSLRTADYRASETGDQADTRLRGLIETHAGMTCLASSTWKKKNTKTWKSPYSEARKKVAKGIFKFDAEISSAPIVVDKPNGKQNWPDCLIVYKKTGLPVEFKRSETGTVVWNSGLPQKGGIYVFNGKDGIMEGTTLFLGTQVIADDIRLLLETMRDINDGAAKLLNNLIADPTWNLYARPMFNGKSKPLSNPTRSIIEDEVMAFLTSLSWG